MLFCKATVGEQHHHVMQLFCKATVDVLHYPMILLLYRVTISATLPSDAAVL